MLRRMCLGEKRSVQRSIEERLGVMEWDDELERLTRSIIDVFGHDVFDAALTRALNAACKHMRPIEGSLLEERGVTSSDGHWSPLSVFYDALRNELQRLAVPH